MTECQKGFTLIELMIVVSIIGILAAIALPHYSDYTSRTRAAATVTEIESIKLAISMCMSEEGAITHCHGGSKGIPDPAHFQYTRNVTNNPNVLSIAAGVIEGTSGATDVHGNPLLFKLTPRQNTSGTNMDWKMEGTICNETRGLKSGAGGC